MPKYRSRTLFVVNGVDMSSYVNAVEYRMAAGETETARVSLVGVAIETMRDEHGCKVVKISIGES